MSMLPIIPILLLWGFPGVASRLAGTSFLPSRPLSLRQQVGVCENSTFAAVLPPNAVVLNATSVSQNGTFGDGETNLPSPNDPTGLPELCAVIVNVTSSESSSYRFGLFLPRVGAWNSRFLAVGNGGFGGGIYWLSMAPGAHQGFATLSTDTGHSSTTTNLTWALNSPEKRTDWGWRAMHGSVELGKKLVEIYYGTKIQYSYYEGCSTGGRQGLKEIQKYPNTFDGVIIGAPAWYTSHLNTYAIQAGIYNLPVDEPHHIPVDLFPAIASEVAAQCDGLDGLQDGVVSSPHLCIPDLTKIQCGNPGVNESACLTEIQIRTTDKIYEDYHSSETGDFFYPGLSPGSEDQWWILFNGTAPSPFGVGYARYFLFDEPDWDWRTYNESVLHYAARHDPGKPTADDYDVSPFRKRGGKILMYHGTADGLIPTKGTQLYFNRTLAVMGGAKDNNTGSCRPLPPQDAEPKPEDIQDFLRFFLVPGMQHCYNTAVDAPWNFAAPGQPALLGTDVWAVPGHERDPEYNSLLALVEWVEKGRPVERLVATTWREATNTSSGFLRDRPVCAYPREAKWDEVGNVDRAESWECR